eukprot:TRINITY_DN67210_c8_g1_i4.p1 TRINITY_DN67210_c8_g1~~TRINITY_DN67210_c8_g1_i4.p1  ORF type:complete len:292 (+),score=35.60 TRINITY_DN67210_c8_g1_i4:56-931(+)
MKQVVAASALLHRLISRLVPPKVWLQQQRQQWETDKAVVDALNDQQHDVVYLRTRLPQGARGTQSEFHIRRSTLTSHSDSLFSVWLSQDSSWDTANDEHSPDGCLMITDDPHPHMFREILFWLRESQRLVTKTPPVLSSAEVSQRLARLVMKKEPNDQSELIAEAAFFGFDELVNELQDPVMQLCCGQENAWIEVQFSTTWHGEVLRFSMYWKPATTEVVHEKRESANVLQFDSADEWFDVIEALTGKPAGDDVKKEYRKAMRLAILRERKREMREKIQARQNNLLRSLYP